MTVLGCRALRVARWTRPGRHDRCLAGPRAAFVNDKMKFTGKPQQAAAEDPTRATPLSRLQELQGACKSLPVNSVEPKRFVNDMGERIGFICGKDVKEQEVLLVVPEALAITAVDAEKHPVVGRVAQQCSELVGLTLWLMAERALGQDSKHAAFLQTLPDNTLSPILWSDADIASMLRGSPVMQEAKNRKSALKRQWEVLSEQFLSKEPAAFSPAVFNEDSFGQAFSVVLGHSTYLPSAECFALVPLIATMGRTGGDNGCNLDYDASTSSVVLTAGRPYREGQEVLLNDGRPNGELVLATGTLQDNNPSDNLLFNAELLPADR